MRSERVVGVVFDEAQQLVALLRGRALHVLEAGNDRKGAAGTQILGARYRS